MEADNGYKKRLIDKFNKLYSGTQGGIFTRKTRDRILTNEGLSGRGITKNQFWYRQRENVKTALIDLQLFVEFAGKENVDQVVTKESLEPVISDLLWLPLFREGKDHNAAQIANMLIRWGFEYFRETAQKGITFSHERTINEALNLSDFLLRIIEES